MILNIYKPVGKTSFEIIKEVKKQYPKEKVGYVGTLDPMADGVLLILVGDDTKKCEELVGLPKEYEFTIVFGVATDSGDILGLVKEQGVKKELEVKEVKGVIEEFKGKYTQTVPAFSSVKYKGKELYKLAHKGLVPTDMPTKTVEIYSISLQKFYTLPYSSLQTEIYGRLGLLGGLGSPAGEFRKEEVVKQWGEFFATCDFGTPVRLLRSRYDCCRKSAKSASGVPSVAKVAKIRAVVSRGTYIRSLAEDIGKKLGVSAMCLIITRTKVGDFVLGSDPKKGRTLSP